MLNRNHEKGKMFLKENGIVGIAEALARKAHAGQFRWNGRTSYITHPEAIAKSFYPVPPYIPKDVLSVCIATAWLHDVLEDTSMGPIDLVEAGLPVEIIEAVETLTKKFKGENYLEYILRVKKNNIATEIKIRDIKHNMADLGEKQKQRKEKYLCALHILGNKKC